MTRSVSIFIVLLIPLSLYSQEPEYLEFVRAETRLQQLFSQLYSDSLTDLEPKLDTIRKELSEKRN